MANTDFTEVYDLFLSKITDDMFMELTESDTYAILQDLLFSALNKFEFPRVNIYDYTPAENSENEQYCGCCSDYKDVIATVYEGGHFNIELSLEEKNIIATYMIVEWLGYQLAAIDNIRLKYSGNDFKFTSQANHLQKVLALKSDYDREGFHLQRLYKRRKTDRNGKILSTWGEVMFDDT